MASARAGLELPATSLIAPLLAARPRLSAAIVVSAVTLAALITRSRRRWQYEVPLGCGFSPAAHRAGRRRQGLVCVGERAGAAPGRRRAIRWQRDVARERPGRWVDDQRDRRGTEDPEDAGGF